MTRSTEIESIELVDVIHLVHKKQKIKIEIIPIENYFMPVVYSENEKATTCHGAIISRHNILMAENAHDLKTELMEFFGDIEITLPRTVTTQPTLH